MMAAGPEATPPSRMSQRTTSFLTRCATGALYVAVFVSALWFSVWTTALIATVFAALVSHELYAMLRSDGKIPNHVLGVFAAAAFPVIAALWGPYGLVVGATLLVVVSLGWYVTFLRSRLPDIALTIVGALYTGFLLAGLVFIRGGGDGKTGAFLAIAVVASVWVNDSFAYIFGSLLGKHKMVPKISPHKSWEGFYAGIVGSLLVWLLIPSLPGVELSYLWAAVGGIACGVSGVVGDLVESRIKREVGVKDSGDALPGHGGFFDRMDSMLLVVPLAYWILFMGGAL